MSDHTHDEHRRPGQGSSAPNDDAPSDAAVAGGGAVRPTPTPGIWTALGYCTHWLCCCGPHHHGPSSPTDAHHQRNARLAAGAEGAPAVTASAADAGSSSSWIRLPAFLGGGRQQQPGFDPGRGYARLPLNFTRSSFGGGEEDEDAQESVECLDHSDERRGLMGDTPSPPPPRHTHNNQASVATTTMDATAEAEAEAAGRKLRIRRNESQPSTIGGMSGGGRGRADSRGSALWLDGAEGGEHDGLGPSSSSSSSSAVPTAMRAAVEKIRRLSALAAIEADVAPVLSASDRGPRLDVKLTLRGPLKSDYACGPGSAVRRLCAEAADGGGEAYLYDSETRAPLDPVAAMDALEDALLGLIGNAPARRARDAAAPAVVGIELVGLTLGGVGSHMASSSATEALLERRSSTTASLDAAEVARRRSHRNDVALHELLPMLAKDFADDYSPAAVSQRGQSFLSAVLEAAASVFLRDLSLSECSFPSPRDFSALLVEAPWCPRATRNPTTGMWRPGLESISVRNCGLTTAHVSDLARATKRATRPGRELPSIAAVERLTLLGQYDGPSVCKLLGSIDDSFPTMTPSASTAEEEEKDPALVAPSEGLLELTVSERALRDVQQHRICSRLQRLNGKPVSLSAAALSPSSQRR